MSSKPHPLLLPPNLRRIGLELKRLEFFSLPGAGILSPLITLVISLH